MVISHQTGKAIGTVGVKHTQVVVIFVRLSSRALNHAQIAQELALGSGKGLENRRHIVNYLKGRVAFDWRALNLSRRCGDLSRSYLKSSRFIVADHRNMSVTAVVQQTGHQKDWWAWNRSYYSCLRVSF